MAPKTPDSNRSDSPPPIVVPRKRAKTKTLLGDEYQEVVTDMPKPLPPLDKASYYKEEALKARLRYADCTLRHPQRKPSPLHLHALQGYKDACVRLLDLEDGEVFDLADAKEIKVIKERWVSVLREYEQAQFYLKTLVMTKSEDAQELQENLLKLQKGVFFARYGDFL